MRPFSGGSSRLMQRSSVLFPEPLAPITHATWPRASSRLTPRSTWRAPKLLCTSSRRSTALSVATGCCAVASTACGPVATLAGAMNPGSRDRLRLCRGSAAALDLALLARDQVVDEPSKRQCHDQEQLRAEHQ